MKQQLNEIKRMQRLAGLIKENEEMSGKRYSSPSEYTKDEIEERWNEIQSDLYMNASDEDKEKEDDLGWFYGGPISKQTDDAFEMEFGMTYDDAMKAAKDA
jgi:hypothetical protein